GAADELVRFAEKSGKTVRGHALVFGQGLPLWILEHGITRKLGIKLPSLDLPLIGPAVGSVVDQALVPVAGWSREELLGIMKTHIRTVMRHFGDKVPEWDVVNEPLNGAGKRANTVWQRYIGRDYIEQ